jgi:hypothetical protein
VFIETARAVGLDFHHYNGMTGQMYLAEIMGSGAALLDFDNDGDLDIYMVQGTTLEPNTSPGATLFPWRGSGQPCGRLYRNDLAADAKTTGKLRFTDVTNESRIAATGYGMGVAAGDFNNDGRIDLYLTNVGPNIMLRNNGDGTFTDVTKETGTDDARWSTSASFFDYDRDGWLDLFVTNYMDFSVAKNPACYADTSARDYCGPSAFRPVPDRLFHNKGNGTFEDVSVASGIVKEFGSGLGVVTADLNRDGYIDIYVANDGDPNQLWINQKNGAFKNEALLAGAAVNRDGLAEAGMGVDAGDFDGDGDDDIFLTHLMEETNTLYDNLGNGMFEDRTVETGLGRQTRRFTGFGAAWFDYDNDGWLDLLSVNGAVRTLAHLAGKGDRYPLGQPNQLFHNTGKGGFIETSSQAGDSFQLLEVSRGAAFGDIDNDGDTDVLICNNNGPARLCLNQIGNRRNWLGLRMVGGKHNRDMLGARVEVVTGKSMSLWRRARTDGSYLSSMDPRVLVGLGDAQSVEVVRVFWPSGAIDEWRNPLINRYVTLKERETRGRN